MTMVKAFATWYLGLKPEAGEKGLKWQKTREDLRAGA
jgi:hypothetical protein